MDNQFILACRVVGIFDMKIIKKLYRIKKQVEIDGKFIHDEFGWFLLLLGLPEVWNLISFHFQRSSFVFVCETFAESELGKLS